MKTNIYKRNTIYEEVWSEPMGIVASRYGISDVMLKKICKQLEIPTPPRGYWAKLKAGKKPDIPKLPKSTGPDTVQGKGASFRENPDSDVGKAADLLSDDETSSLYLASDKLRYNQSIHLRPCPEEIKTEYDFPERILRVNHPQFFSFVESINKESVPHALAITESIAEAVEHMGGHMEKPFIFELLGENVELQISERTRRIEHSITAQEAEDLREYEEKRKTYSWYRKPQVRKWDYEFTGKLKFAVAVRYGYKCRESVAAASRSLVQKDDTNLDELMVRILHLICKACAAMRSQRLEEAEAVHLREVEFQEECSRVEEYNEEIAKFNDLLQEARRYEEARILRDYANALCEKNGTPSPKAEWIRAKADWIDPLTRSSDEILGELSSSDYPPSLKPFPERRRVYSSIDRYYHQSSRADT